MEKPTSKGAERDERELWDTDTPSLSRPPTYASNISTPPSYQSQTSYPTPTYSTKEPPSAELFHALLATNSQLVNIVLSDPANPDSPLFYVSNSQWTPGKPSVTITRGSKTGPILGVLKLGWGAENVYGLGDPEKEKTGEGIMRWEGLKRTSKWTHGTYEFVFAERNFVWQRTRQMIFADQPDMELRERLRSEVQGGETVENDGEVLAVYIGCQGWERKRGRFYLRNGEFSVGSSTSGGKEGEVWGDWEIAALLTGLGVIEGARRRARQRRGGGGG
jgi:hypothetical protein